MKGQIKDGRKELEKILNCDMNVYLYIYKNEKNKYDIGYDAYNTFVMIYRDIENMGKAIDIANSVKENSFLGDWCKVENLSI